MKNFTMNMTIAAAALLVAAGVAGAQTIKAEVPFGFRAAGTVMPAGSYRVNASYVSGGTRVFQLTHEDTNRSIIAVPYTYDNQKPAEADKATLTFECSGADCALVQVAPGSGQSYHFMKHKAGSDGDTRLAVIRAAIVSAR